MLETPGPVPAHRPPTTASAATDDRLLADLRGGREQAFAELYARHHRTAAGVARRVVGSGPAVDDVVADSFTALLSAVRRGGGPSSNVRSYLLTTVRNTAVGYLRARERAIPAEADVIDRPHHDPDGLVGADDEQRVRRAFAALPPRWRRVLWYVDVHELAPAHVGPLLGISPNAVSSLARRARERLRREYLQAHQDRVAPGCEDYAPHLARFVEQALAAPVQRRLEVHVLACAPCSTAVEQMRDLKSRMRGILLPVGLATAATVAPLRTRRARARSRAGTAAGALSPAAALALGRRWWWSRPRDKRPVLLLATPAVALGLLLIASLVTAPEAGDLGARADSPPTAAPPPGAPTPDAVGPDDAEPDRGERDQRDPEEDGPGSREPDPDGPGPDDPGPDDPGPDDPGPEQSAPDRSRPAATPPGTDDTGPGPPGPGPDHPEGPGPPTPGPPDETPPPGTDPPDPDPTEPPPDPEPQVVQVAHDDLGDLVPGRAGVLGATVTNPNPGAVGPVTVDLALPAGIELDTAHAARAASAWTCADPPGSDGPSCTVGTIAGGTAATLLVPVLVATDVPEGAAAVRLDVGGDDVQPTGADLAVPVSVSPLAARYVATGDVGVAQAGAPVLHCAPSAPGCASAAAGTATGGALNNNGWTMAPVDALGTGTNSSTAELDLPEGSEVVAARLYWAGSCAGEVGPVRLAPPDGELAAVGETADLAVERSGEAYQAGVDVTDVVRAGGAGTWAVADVCAIPGDGRWAGWALVVVHRSATPDPAAAGLAIVYDGWMGVTPDQTPRFAAAGRPGTAVRVGVVAWDGDRGADGNRLLLDGAPLVPLRWDGSAPAGPGSPHGAFDSTAWGSGYANALGVDVRPFAPATLTGPRAEITAATDTDYYTIGAVTVVTGSDP
ncbi:sigma-70 family RNA polymerase sigma factor [Myceligenerans pegani]|uniref:Sigma-70 family RNA polymerase sigma factor n=1 Tax=Myceligenerans pegani TaxID=2776917 RepID=A0ABR9N189_9MICO|nr:sigma-70 family RNA polymerase sigma factor [Myceligenerans sp. TRM 65318]MBE1877423.1 sigma-70 family RNA polymerase sigma factor [Myceligenerans sp. TRM 65318]MBE3019694.1 sigma-70 family RNA polymerase sigma factor [Myceligenerans sp. TRM 65318]